MTLQRGTLVVLLVAILLFAFYGWKVFGYIALFGLLVVVFAIGSVAWALYRVKRQLRHTMQEAVKAYEAANPGQTARRPDAIDVEGHVVRKPRDGADDPDDLQR